MKMRGIVLAAAITTGVTLSSIPVAFAAGSSNAPDSFTTQTTVTPQQTSITLVVPNLDSKLQPAPSLTFTFTLGAALGNGGTNPMVETGTLINPATSTYQIPLPNYGQKETVWVSTSYESNGFQYTATAGPLIDTLPEVSLAALLPLALVGGWYYNRKRRAASQV